MIVYKNENEISISGNDQYFTQKDCDELWREHNIIYSQMDITAIWVEERNGMNPLIHFMNEDDGHIYWQKEKDICFDSCFINQHIKILNNVLTKIKKD